MFPELNILSSTAAVDVCPFGCGARIALARAADKMSSPISDLISAPADVVRLLPLALKRMISKLPLKRNDDGWRAGSDFRVICDCQRHARRERTLWRRSVRLAHGAAHEVRKRGVAIAVGLPLAFCALVLPTEAMNVSLPALAQRAISMRQERTLPIFTTDKTRKAFLAPQLAQQTFTIDVVKEEFFATQVPYGRIIYREAKKNHLPPELVAAVVESESDFRATLISNKNAKGLMQIIPETGRLMGADDLFDPEENIAAGTKYLRYLFNRFGDQKMVLAAYNAGEGNVERFGGVPPFAETQSYLSRVSRRASEYRQRVNGRYVASLRMQGTIVR